jgi:hypothetical protein
MASAASDERNSVTLRPEPVCQFHEGKIWELAIHLDKKYVHAVNGAKIVS